MTNRRTLSPRRKIEIAELRGWRAPEGGMLCLENRNVVFLGTGKRPKWDHIHPLADGGGNEGDNFQPMTSEAHQEKTSGEASARKRVRRILKQNKPKRKYYWPKRPFGIPGLRKKFDGTVVKA